MKVALLLSGQPRSFEKGYEYHKKNLLDHYNVDVFMHTWADVPQKIQHGLQYLYGGHLTTTSFDQHSQAIVDNQFTNIPNSQFPARNTYAMFNSMYRAFELMRYNYTQWALEYDVIVRSRYDYALNVKLPLDQTEVGKVYVPNDRMTLQHDFCADMFAFGTPKVMETYMTTFKYLEFYHNEGTTMIGEDMLARQLKEYGYIGENMVYVDMKPCFHPGKYNGNMHNIIRDDFSEWNKLRN